MDSPLLQSFVPSYARNHPLWRYVEGFYAQKITSYRPPPATGVLADLPVVGKEWMQPWVEEFYREGITTESAENPLQYCPEASVTRAAMAVFISKAYSLAQLP